MSELNFSFQNVIDGNGIGLALTGMTIVFVALSLISIFIANLPRLLQFLPPPAQHHAPAPRPAAPQTDEAAVVAAAFAVHRHGSGS